MKFFNVVLIFIYVNLGLSVINKVFGLNYHFRRLVLYFKNRELKAKYDRRVVLERLKKI